MKPPTKKKQVIIHGRDCSTIQNADNPFNIPDLNNDWVVGIHSTAASGDRCHNKSWGVFRLEV